MHCKRGHLLEGTNVYKNPRGTIECKSCRREATKRSYWRNVEKERAARRSYWANTARFAPYGITRDEYENLLLLQGGACPICGTKKPGGVSDVWHIDHDHSSGLIRGLLCSRCNLGVGQFNDDPDRMRSAILYLERTGS